MEIKRKDLSRYLGVFRELSNIKTGFKFAYVVAKNTRLVQQELDHIQKALAPSPEYQQYEQERMSLCARLSLSEKGQPIIVNNNFRIDPTKKDEFDNQIKEIQEKYKIEIEHQQKKIEEFNETLEETMDLDLHKIKKSYFPDEIIGNYVLTLFDLIEDEN